MATKTIESKIFRLENNLMFSLIFLTVCVCDDFIFEARTTFVRSNSKHLFMRILSNLIRSSELIGISVESVNRFEAFIRNSTKI